MPLSFSKKQVRIVLLENISPTAHAVFERAGYSNIEEVPGALEGDPLLEKIGDARILGIRSTSKLTKDFFEKVRKVMTIGCFCIGTNQVDLQRAMTKGIPVFNAPFSNTRSVAELTISSLIALMRKTPEKNAALHRGAWIKSASGAHEVRGKTLGIVGYGNIGTQLGVLAEQLGMHVIFYDPVKKLPLGNAKSSLSLKEVLASSDTVSLHVPETPDTKNMIGREEIQSMRKGTCLINYSRGSVVDIDALADALRTGHIGGAAIDVFPKEPKSKKEEFASPLRGLDNALLSPHVGGSTEEAQSAIGTEVAEKLVTYFDNGSTTSSVNFPNVALPQHAGAVRILNIHENKPGVLSAINDALSERNANIVGQFLQTNAHIGYVVTDIEIEDDPEDLRQVLRAIPGSVRTRILNHAVS